MSESTLAFEHPFLKVPYENYRKVFRTSQKHIEREFTKILSSLSSPSSDIGSALDRIRFLKSKLEELEKESGAPTLSVLHDRLTHLQHSSQEQEKWAETRLDRWIVDWSMRNGKEKTARMVARDKHIERLVDLELFTDIRRISTALSQHHSCTEALQWCTLNKSTLRKLPENTLEFELRLQEYIELCRTNQQIQAIAYSKKHLIPFASTHLSTITTAHALLVYPNTTTVNPYKKLYSPSRWHLLSHQFTSTILHIHSIPPTPTLLLSLYAGLSALKLQACYSDSKRVVDCPICEDREGLGRLAEEVGEGYHANSVIVCEMSKEIMDQDNMPLAFPNGRVYSTKALESMAREHNGIVTCPRTGYVCHYNELRKVFIS